MNSLGFIMGGINIVISIFLIVQGVFYLVKTGYWYNKQIEKRSETYLRNMGIITVIMGTLVLITSITLILEI